LFAFLITIHVIICIGLIITVLMQSAKGEGLAGAFGGGGGLSGAVFGGRGAAPFLSKATTTLAILFMTMCILLTLTTGGGRVQSGAVGTSAVQDYAREQAAPVTPSDVQPVNVGQQPAQQQGELPVTVTPTPKTTDEGQQPTQPAPEPEQGSGGQ